MFGDHDSCSGLADSARRRARHYAGADRLSQIAGRHGAHSQPHRCGGFERAGSGQRADALRHGAAAVAGDCGRPADAATTGSALERFQHGPGAFKIDYALSRAGSVARAGLPARNHCAPGRHVRGDCRGRGRGGARTLRRAAVCAGGAADALRSVARAGRASMCCGRIAMCPTGRPST